MPEEKQLMLLQAGSSANQILLLNQLSKHCAFLSVNLSVWSFFWLKDSILLRNIR